MSKNINFSVYFVCLDNSEMMILFLFSIKIILRSDITSRLLEPLKYSLQKIFSDKPPILTILVFISNFPPETASNNHLFGGCVCTFV